MLKPMEGPEKFGQKHRMSAFIFLLARKQLCLLMKLEKHM